jgi:putative oxidoreductase
MNPEVRQLSWNRAKQMAFFLLRIVSGFLFLQAGGMKLFGWFGGVPGMKTVPLLTELGVAGVLEFFGGTAIFLGLFTRPVAFILSGEMAVAYWQVHAPQAPWPIVNQGMPAILFCFIFLFFAANGAGGWSLDAWLRHRG